MVRKALRVFRDDDGSNLLHFSCGAKRHRISKILLDLNIFDVNEQNERGSTALHLAAESDTDRCIKSLLIHGADVTKTDLKGNTIFHIVCKKNSIKCLTVVLESEKVNMFPTLYNAYNKNRKTALHYAAEFAEATCLQSLLKFKDINLELVDNKYRTPLHIAANSGSIEAVDLLLSKGANPNAQDYLGNTPLHYVALRGLEISAATLVKKGSKVTMMNTAMKTPLHFAVENNNEGVATILTSNGADVAIRYHYLRKQMDSHRNIPKSLEAITNRYGFLEEDENGKEIKKYKLSTKGAWRRYEQERDRAKRWNQMIVNWDSWIKYKRTAVKKRVGKGLPDSLRGEAWKKLTGADKAKRENPSSYTQLMVQPSQWSEQIDLDINRTYRNHIVFRERFGQGQVELFHILNAYAAYDPDVGYCQGMSDITGFLLMYIPEEDAFWTLVQLLNDKRYDLHSRFLPGFPRLYESFFVFEKIIEKRFPKIAQNFKRENIVTAIYATRWFLMAFLDAFTFPVMVRLWDMLFFYGYDIVYSIGVAIFKRYEAELSTKDMEGVNQIFKSLEANHDIDPEDFVKQVLKNRIKPKQIRKLEEEYKLNPR